jgi:hypothetical protein
MAKRGRPKGLPSFFRVSRAKELLASRAEQLAKDVLKASKVASARGNHMPAVWALEHISVVDEAGKELRPIAPGIDRQQVEAGSRAPTINIGWVIAPGPQQALPVAPQQALPAVLDAEPLDD